MWRYILHLTKPRLLPSSVGAPSKSSFGQLPISGGYLNPPYASRGGTGVRTESLLSELPTGHERWMDGSVALTPAGSIGVLSWFVDEDPCCCRWWEDGTPEGRQNPFRDRFCSSLGATKTIYLVAKVQPVDATPGKGSDYQFSNSLLSMLNHPFSLLNCYAGAVSLERASN